MIEEEGSLVNEDRDNPEKQAFCREHGLELHDPAI
jgi:hypothetical protein